MDPAHEKVRIGQGHIQKNCKYCGEPMDVAKGAITEHRDENGAVIKKTQANDQRAIFHGRCRKLGRRQERRIAKENRRLS